MRHLLGPGGSGWPPAPACSVAQSPELLWASPISRKGMSPHSLPNGLSSLSLQPQTNSTKNSAAATSPKGPSSSRLGTEPLCPLLLAILSCTPAVWWSLSEA